MTPPNPANRAIKRAATFEETQFLIVAALSSKWSDVAEYLGIEGVAAAQAKIYEIRAALFTPLGKEEKKAMNASKKAEASTAGTPSTVNTIQPIKLEDVSDQALEARLAEIDKEADDIQDEMGIRKETRLLEGKLKEEEERLKAEKADTLARIKREEDEIRRQREAIRGLALKNARVKRERESEDREDAESRRKSVKTELEAEDGGEEHVAKKIKM